MRQLSLFDDSRPARYRGPLDAESERYLQAFVEERLRQGASRRSVLREVSQIRSLARECGSRDRRLPLATVFADVKLIAKVLREPSNPISRSTSRTRLVATQRFVRIVGPLLGRDAQADLSALDALLPARPRPGTWRAPSSPVNPGDVGATARRSMQRTQAGSSTSRRRVARESWRSAIGRSPPSCASAVCGPRRSSRSGGRTSKRA